MILKFIWKNKEVRESEGMSRNKGCQRELRRDRRHTQVRGPRFQTQQQSVTLCVKARQRRDCWETEGHGVVRTRTAVSKACIKMKKTDVRRGGAHL